MKAVHFRPDLNVKDREQELKKLCISEKEDNFFRTLTDSDVDKEKHNYAEKGAELKNKKLEAKASADTFKSEIQGIEKIQDEVLIRIETRKRKVYDKLYGLANYANGLMEYYDRFGEMIDSRKLTPDEATGHLFNNDGDATTSQSTPAENTMKQIGNAAASKYDNDLNDGQNSDIQDAKFEEVKDSEPNPETSTNEEKPKKGRGRGKAKKDDEPKEE